MDVVAKDPSEPGSVVRVAGVEYRRKAFLHYQFDLLDEYPRNAACFLVASPPIVDRLYCLPHKAIADIRGLFAAIEAPSGQMCKRSAGNS